MEALYLKYLSLTKLKSSSIAHYKTAINTINSILKKYNFVLKSVYDIKSHEDLISIKIFLDNNAEYIQKNTIGKAMYSNGFRYFCEFIESSIEFFEDNIINGNMDIALEVPELISVEKHEYKRNKLISEQAIIGADYKCESNQSHTSFISKSTGHYYMEGHHLIPMKHQSLFGNSLDVYSNIVSLCPTCHKMLHYGEVCDRKYLLEKFYDERNSRLIKCGIDVSRKEFIDLAIK